MPRRSDFYLRDIVERAEVIRRSVQGRSLEQLLADDDAADALLYRLIIIGETIANLPPELRERYASVDWAAAVGFRNRIVHAYFSLDWTIVWQTARDDIPKLAAAIDQILEAEFPLSDTKPRRDGANS